MRQTHRSRMSTPRLTKLRKQPNSTWAQLQKRLIALPDPFETLFPVEVWSFILNKSHSISTNPGYVSSTLITTTAFMAGTATTLKTATQEMPLNIYSIFVGPPTTGKSQAIKECAISPMASVTAEADSASPVIQKCTSSGLIKTVADNNRGFLLSAEIYDVLFKLLKSDEENATGDVQALCQLFSGEEASYRYATEKTREIAANTPFCILGATQIPFAARLVALLDQGHGLFFVFNYIPKVLATDANANKPGNRSLKRERPFQRRRHIRGDCSPASFTFHLHSRPRGHRNCEHHKRTIYSRGK